MVNESCILEDSGQHGMFSTMEYGQCRFSAKSHFADIPASVCFWYNSVQIVRTEPSSVSPLVSVTSTTSALAFYSPRIPPIPTFDKEPDFLCTFRA